jgi:hypothetical protein
MLFGRHAALAGFAALALSAVAAPISHAPPPAPRYNPDPEPGRWKGRAFKKSGGRKRGWGRYKGSPAAKRATARGGNPARH